MNDVKTLLCSAALAMSAPLAAQAHTAIYSADLLGGSEVPPVTTTGNGSATVTIDFDLLTMRVQTSFADLIGNVSAAHIHCCTAPGANVGVASITPSFTGFPLGVKAGSYDFTYDMALSASYHPTFLANNGATPSGAFSALVAGLDAGRAYVNIHTTSFAGGEIRALLVPVPEPETYAMLLAGLGVVGFMARRQRRPS